MGVTASASGKKASVIVAVLSAITLVVAEVT